MTVSASELDSSLTVSLEGFLDVLSSVSKKAFHIWNRFRKMIITRILSWLMLYFVVIVNCLVLINWHAFYFYKVFLQRHTWSLVQSFFNHIVK